MAETMWTHEEYLNSDVVTQIRKTYKCEVGITAAKALVILSLVEGGLHHMFGFPKKMVKDPAYWNEFFFEYVCDFNLSTYDFDRLTRLVVLAHDHCLRMEIGRYGLNGVLLRFHNRTRDGERMWDRHPTIEQAINSIRRESERVHSSPTAPAPAQQATESKE